MRRIIPIACCLAFVAGTAAAQEPTGDWLVENGKGIIHIENCGGTLWGVVAWENTPGRDSENPDPALRGRPTLGIPILIEMRAGRADSGGAQRWEGHVYNAENGKTYIANIKLTAPNSLRIEGCVLGGLFCGGQQWTRTQMPAQGPQGQAQAKSAPPPAPQAKAQAKGQPRPAGPALASAASDVCSRMSSLSGATH